ncbi:DUF1045 domain-containing protein [Aureimonas jatrophae]|uniref:Putative phosphonate metabolism protein n=1 Tax=Aureimonas jatrophae TaxID=1166073 RepID=A0A1H0C6Y1_9HYPH|nr:DUF1045 domain-containing protein [Aureimonas jatrophae]MBB3949094.1 putative phosphonate metabolism protein [Aureimonas jatrophae]SDN53615.1 putative phosphonate metabolism protein [Aureimonas jatrophae]
MRAALYYAPAQDAPLTRLAAEWLGRDAFTGEATRAPDEGLDPLVADPARYGFHATVKAPFRLAEGVGLDALDAELARFAATREAPVIARLTLSRSDGFFALVPGDPEPALDAMVAEAVRHFEPFRAPLTPAEFERRRPDRLTERQRAYLAEWGYPHVFEEFRFHMTLTGRTDDAEAAELAPMLAARFDKAIDRPLTVDALALFVEREAGGPFTVHSRHAFRPPNASAS